MQKYRISFHNSFILKPMLDYHYFAKQKIDHFTTNFYLETCLAKFRVVMFVLGSQSYQLRVAVHCNQSRVLQYHRILVTATSPFCFVQGSLCKKPCFQKSTLFYQSQHPSIDHFHRGSLLFRIQFRSNTCFLKTGYA